MTNLSLSTKYYYRVGDPLTNTWSREFTFQTIADNTTKNGIRIFAYGDQGKTPNSEDLLKNMQQRGLPDFILHAGGNVSRYQ
jgi:hypothetical protein